MTTLTDEQIADLLGRITKGPWRVGRRRNKKSGKAFLFVGGKFWEEFARVVVRFHGDTQDDIEGPANASAIALVPELLAEVARLREVLRAVDDDVRHHLRSEVVDHALLRKHVVSMVRTALPTGVGLLGAPEPPK